MPPPVQYDFAAAEELASALRYLRQKLADLHNLRRELRDGQLDCVDLPGVSVPWRGAARRVFDGAFDAQQAELIRLSHEALALRGKVQAATEDALRDQRKTG